MTSIHVDLDSVEWTPGSRGPSISSRHQGRRHNSQSAMNVAAKPLPA
jgi:hypothetical protein